MRKILMLDLENTIIGFDRDTLAYIEKRSDDSTCIRPYTEQFLDFCRENFDELYMNTCSSISVTEKIMDFLNARDFKYHQWDKHSKYGKASKYHEFKDSLIIHIEDSLELDVPEHQISPERKRMKELSNVEFVAIEPYFPNIYRKYEELNIPLPEEVDLEAITKGYETTMNKINQIFKERNLI